MAKSIKPPTTGTGQEAPPHVFPQIRPPDSYPQAVSSTWMAECLMQLQNSIGKMESSFGHLKESPESNFKRLQDSTDKQSAKVDRLSHIIYAAAAVLALLVAVGSFLVNKAWDPLIAVLTKAPPPVVMSPSNERSNGTSP
jgi:hypothetical protein